MASSQDRPGGISWTDVTWNPVRGCARVSLGCGGSDGGGCYAAGKITLVPEALEQPLHWKKPRKVFVNSMSDLFHEGVPDEFIEYVFGIMALAQQHTFQILTKRPERLAHWFRGPVGDIESREDAVQRAAEFKGKMVWDGRGNDPYLYDRATKESVANRRKWPGWPLPNVWLGASVENQEAANERIPLLLQTPAAVRFLSVEPMLGMVGLHRIPDPQLTSPNFPGGIPFDALSKKGGIAYHAGLGIDWVIVGGESGQHARPMHPDWARSIRDQCQEAWVPFFFKQWGEGGPTAEHGFGDQRPLETCTFSNGDGTGVEVTHVGKKAAGRLLDGREWSEFPVAQEVKG